MIISKIKSKSSYSHKWDCLKSWMRENKIPQLKKEKHSVIFNPTVKPF